MRTQPRPGNRNSSTPGAGDTALAGAPVRVTVVESEACHFCADAQQVLFEAAANYPLELRTVNVRSPEGAKLMQAHRATMSPLVLLDGAFFSNGRLPRRKLAKVLGQRFAAPPVTGKDSPRGGGHHG